MGKNGVSKVGDGPGPGTDPQQVRVGTAVVHAQESSSQRWFCQTCVVSGSGSCFLKHARVPQIHTGLDKTGPTR